MKEILILRHAKSDWSHGGMDDIDRPLNPRGQEDAVLMGEFIQQAGLLPHMVYLSPARRVQETWQGITSSWNNSIPSETIPHLYLATAQALFSAVIQCSGECERVMIIAHNPGLEELVSYLCGVEVNVRMATATLAQLQSDHSQWGQIQHSEMTLKGLVYPKILKGSLK